MSRSSGMFCVVVLIAEEGQPLTMTGGLGMM
jgi:hypothetical protein